MYTIIMPKAGMAMEAGTIIKWLKDEGEAVEAGEPILEIETDKVAMEVEAAGGGTLLKILALPGDVVPVTLPIGYIGAPGEAVPQDGAPPKAEPDKEEEQNVQTQAAPPVPEGRMPATPLAKSLAKEYGVDLGAVVPSGSAGEIKARDVERAVKATPLARRVAGIEGVDISAMNPSGEKIRKDDVLSFLQEQSAPGGELRPLSAMRSAIGKRMLYSHQNAPPVTLHSSADVTALASMRAQINACQDVKFTWNDFILKATALALKSHPYMNASYEKDGIYIHESVNLGIAVAVSEGLLVPVLKNSEAVTLSGLAHNAKALYEKAHSRALRSEDLEGGTFTVSNLGMLGIDAFTPMLVPSQAGILGVCAIKEQYVRTESGGEWRQMLGLSLTFDHRMVDGSQAAVFLTAVRELLERPYAILV